MKLGIFGGTFDPVHYGHLLLAELCRESCALDRIWFMAAHVPPHKPQQGLSDDSHRLEMLRLAIGGHDAMEVSDIEVRRGGVSYTVDTLRQITRTENDVELYFLMGGDSLVDLPTWREPEEICRLCIPVIVGRPDAPPPNLNVLKSFVNDERLEIIRRHEVLMPLIQLSSSEIRQRVSRGQSIRYQTPRAVEKYIEAQRLYRE